MQASRGFVFPFMITPASPRSVRPSSCPHPYPQPHSPYPIFNIQFYASPTPHPSCRSHSKPASWAASLIRFFSSLLAPGNDAYNTALQVLRNRNLAGRFWSL